MKTPVKIPRFSKRRDSWRGCVRSMRLDTHPSLRREGESRSSKVEPHRNLAEGSIDVGPKIGGNDRSLLRRVVFYRLSIAARLTRMQMKREPQVVLRCLKCTRAYLEGSEASRCKFNEGPKGIFASQLGRVRRSPFVWGRLAWKRGSRYEIVGSRTKLTTRSSRIDIITNGEGRRRRSKEEDEYDSIASRLFATGIRRRR